MKAQKVYFPNDEVLEIHLDKSLLRFAFEPDDTLSLMGRRKGNPVLANRLMRIKGVTEVDIASSTETKHVIRLSKGRLFDWKIISKKAMKTISEIVAPKEELKLLPDAYES